MKIEIEISRGNLTNQKILEELIEEFIKRLKLFGVTILNYSVPKLN